MASHVLSLKNRVVVEFYNVIASHPVGRITKLALGATPQKSVTVVGRIATRLIAAVRPYNAKIKKLSEEEEDVKLAYQHRVDQLQKQYEEHCDRGIIVSDGKQKKRCEHDDDRKPEDKTPKPCERALQEEQKEASEEFVKELESLGILDRKQKLLDTEGMELVNIELSDDLFKAAQKVYGDYVAAIAEREQATPEEREKLPQVYILGMPVIRSEIERALELGETAEEKDDLDLAIKLGWEEYSENRQRMDHVERLKKDLKVAV